MTAREERLLHVLCLVVRLLSTRQAMRLLRFGDEANFNRFVRGLIARELVARITVWAKPVPEMVGPLLAFERVDFVAHGLVGRALGGAVLSEEALRAALERVIYLAWRRWAEVTAVPTPCIVATARGAERLYGVHRPGSLAQPLSVSHDLTLSEVAVRHLTTTNPTQTGHWRGEDATDFTLGTKHPDLVLYGGDPRERRILKVIEVVGADYTSERLLQIHRECRARGIAHELW